VGAHGFLREHNITTFLVLASRASRRFARQTIFAANARIGKPLPSSIATLSLGPEGPLLTKSTSDQLHVAVPLPEDAEILRMTSSLSSNEDDDRENEEQLLKEAHGERKETYERGGELALYAMFFRISGRMSMLVFVFLLCIFVGAFTYPSELPSSKML
jgi:hypothetical protein